MFAVCRLLLLALSVFLGGVAFAAAPVPMTGQVSGQVSGPGPAAAPPPGGAYPLDGIAAVVDDQIISVDDLAARIKMVMLSTNIGDSPEMRQRLSSQVLRTMIDEKLELEEGKRQNISVTDAEVDKAVASIAKQNNMTAAQLTDVLKSHGIDQSALIDQLKASIVWVKLVHERAAETGPISDQEVDAAMKQLKQTEHQAESRVAEIFLAVDNPQQDDSVRQLALKLIAEMKQGARFSAVAQQFSQSPTAAVGGDLGWISPQELPAELAQVVAQMRPGELSPPIRTPAGYYLLVVLERRGGNTNDPGDTRLHIVQVVFPLPPQASAAAREAAFARAESTRESAKSCDDMLRIGREKAPQLSSAGDLMVSQIAPAMRSFVIGLGIGKPSQPILQKNGVGVIMVCSKSAPGPAAPLTREEVQHSLIRQRLDIAARRYLRDLRQAAFVDVRV
jgi:peptidyl-prolyl cis-trans isomerase SurA